jgi:hypothetical protein
MTRHRYSIIVAEHGQTESTICQVDTNPQAIAEALKAKLSDERPLRKMGVKKYAWVRVIDNAENAGKDCPF